VGGRHNLSPPPASWPFDLESGIRVTCDVGYLCANFSLPKPLCSRFRPDVRNRQTSDQTRINAPYRRYMRGHNRAFSDKRGQQIMSWSRCTTWPASSSHIACSRPTPRSTTCYEKVVVQDNCRVQVGRVASYVNFTMNKLCAWRHNMPLLIPQRLARRRADAT